MKVGGKPLLAEPPTLAGEGAFVPLVFLLSFAAFIRPARMGNALYSELEEALHGRAL